MNGNANQVQIIQQPAPLNPATIPLPPSVATALQSINEKVAARQAKQAIQDLATQPAPPPPQTITIAKQEAPQVVAIPQAATAVMFDADNPLSTAAQEEEAVDDANKTIGSEDVTIGVVKASIVGIRVRSKSQIGRLLLYNVLDHFDYFSTIRELFQKARGSPSSESRRILTTETPSESTTASASRLATSGGSKQPHSRSSSTKVSELRLFEYSRYVGKLHD